MTERKKAVFSRLVPLAIGMFAVPVVISTLTACSDQTGSNQAESKKPGYLPLFPKTVNSRINR